MVAKGIGIIFSMTH